MVFQANKRSSQSEYIPVNPSQASFNEPEDSSHSIIGKGLTLKGEIVCQENLTVEGKVEGTITTVKQMSSGRSGHIKADIKAHNVRIEGFVSGSLQADGKVEILSGGSFSGNLSSQRLVIQEGAILQAEVMMEE